MEEKENPSETKKNDNTLEPLAIDHDVWVELNNRKDKTGVPLKTQIRILVLGTAKKEEKQ